eukprot:CAMPEP_0197846372 /NCGR_PEP_ID=MMETSP1438-20131217/3124_1 /TAXON_ID=1461541 /ORGANISM="Pterosperma sp., Strain CCMP1384" /LENGTH=324 /DNA_ID=CAMNT_0043457995 /DNA_START=430 /DNA_END=1404 /DNA_ORIENTATION=-
MIDGLEKKLSVDLRKHIRKLQVYPVFTQEWFIMVETLQHITNVAIAEQKLPPKDSTDGGTLWDRDELTVRFVLEEGKLNVCLRCLVEFKAYMRDNNADNELQSVCQEYHLDRKLVDQNILSFEESMGTLLKCCFRSVETIQTCDLPILVKYCSDVISNCLHAGVLEPLLEKKIAEKTQEEMCITYLYQLTTHMEQVSEDQVMNLLEENKSVQFLVDILHSYGEHLSPRVQDQGCQCLSLIFDSEAFSTHREKYIGSDATKSQLVALKSTPLLTEKVNDFSKKRSVQYLLDVIARLENTGVQPASASTLDAKLSKNSSNGDSAST